MREFLKRIGRALGLVAKPRPLPLTMGPYSPPGTVNGLFRHLILESMAREGEKIGERMMEQSRMAAAAAQRRASERLAPGGTVEILVLGRVGDGSEVPPELRAFLRLGAANQRLRLAADYFVAVVEDALQNG